VVPPESNRIEIGESLIQDKSWFSLTAPSDRYDPSNRGAE
jgi:hypothetical protein